MSTTKYFKTMVNGVEVLRSPPNPRRRYRNARGKHTFATSSVTKVDTPTHKHRYKPPSEKGKPLRYRVHVIRNVGHKETQIWIPLATYKHLSSAYKKVTALRAHFNKHHTNHTILRDYTIFIEFRGTGMIRAFNLTPEYSLNSVRTSSTPGMGFSQTTSWYTPKSWIMHDEYKRKKTKKRKSTATPVATTSVPITGGPTPKARPEKGKPKRKDKRTKAKPKSTATSKRTSKAKGDAPNLVLTVPQDTMKAMPPTILEQFKSVLRYFHALVPSQKGQTA